MLEQVFLIYCSQLLLKGTQIQELRWDVNLVDKRVILLVLNCDFD